MIKDKAVTRELADKAAERRLKEAAQWFLRLQREPSDRTLRRWKRWEAIPENREVFDAVERAWSHSLSVPRMPAPTQEERIADEYDGTMSVTEWQRQGLRRKSSPWRNILGALSLAAVATASVVGLIWAMVLMGNFGHGHDPTPTVVFETGIGEHKDFVLEDGSRLHLGALTTVTARFDKGQRYLALDQGEALFNVKRDPTRPFQVYAGTGVVTAIGTAFNIRRRQDDDVVVTVTEGIVEVTPAAMPIPAAGELGRDKSPFAHRLVRGQEIAFDGNGRFGQIRTAASVAWLDGRILYRREPLRNVIEDINRYSERQVVIDDSTVGELLYSGTVFEDKIDKWIAGLNEIFPEIEVHAAQDGRVILRATRTTNIHP